MPTSAVSESASNFLPTRRRLKSSFARTATPATAVFDASTFVRALPTVGDEATASAWIEAALDGRVRVTAPDLVYGEVANALLRYVRAGALASADADEAMRLILEVPLRAVSLRRLAADALTLAVDMGLSAYDATYVLLAEATDSTLVTADRRLATAVKGVALIPNDGPPALNRR